MENIERIIQMVKDNLNVDEIINGLVNDYSVLEYKSDSTNNKSFFEWLFYNYDCSSSFFENIPIWRFVGRNFKEKYVYLYKFLDENVEEESDYSKNNRKKLIRILQKRLKNKNIVINLNNKKIFSRHFNHFDDDSCITLELITILRAYGIDINYNVSIGINENDDNSLQIEYAKKKYEDNKVNAQTKKLLPEELQLINEFRNLMLQDGESSPEIIELACQSFILQFSNKTEFAKRNIQLLIEMKQKYPNFRLLMSKEESGVVGHTVYICEKQIHSFTAINHELGHVIHNLMAKNEAISLFEDSKDFFDDKGNLNIDIKERINGYVSFIYKSGNLESIDDFYKNLVKKSIDYNFLKEYLFTLKQIILNEFDGDSRTNMRDTLDSFIILAQERYEKYLLKYLQLYMLDYDLMDFTYTIEPFLNIVLDGYLYENGANEFDYSFVAHSKEVLQFTGWSGRHNNYFNEAFAIYYSIISSPNKDLIEKILAIVLGDDLKNKIFKELEKFFNEKISISSLKK